MEKTNYAKFTTLLAFLMLFPLFSEAQTRSLAKQQLQELKENGIIIRFDTKEFVINGLENKGRLEEAQEVKIELAKLKSEIIESFKKYYTYSKVYICDSDELTNGKAVKTVRDLDSNLVSLDTDAKKYYVLNPHRVYFEAFGDYHHGFGIVDINLKNIPKPFPYYVMKREGLFFLRIPFSAMVLKLQRKFVKFESRN